jgi:N-acetyl sugar amidotransferase
MNKKNDTQQCIRCVMDTSTKTLTTFSEQGVCNICSSFDVLAQKTINRPLDTREKELEDKIKLIKAEGKGKKYDCIIGLSGGVDSTYVAYLVHNYGLRALAVHFDNGWNSELAVYNIESIIRKTGFDLYTYVVNWEEFKDLQRAYLKASVIDIEALSDHMIVASLYKLAAKYQVKNIISGTNIATEAILPTDWVYSKRDLDNIINIHNKFGSIPLKTYPKIGFIQRLYYTEYKKINFVEVLDLVDYNKHKVKDFIIDYFGWRDYGGKHYESIWTKFYQGYILPVKFGVDKRKAHLSNLICTKEITRENALSELSTPSIPSDEVDELIQYVCTKLDFSRSEFDAIMKEKPIPHQYYGAEKDSKVNRIILRIVNFILWRTQKRLLYLS